MKLPFETTRTHFFGTSEERWAEAGAECVDRTVNGHTSPFPIFDIEISDFDEISNESLWSGGKEIGSLHTFNVETNGNNRRNAYFWNVAEAHNADYDLAVSDRPALTTEIEGYPYVRARELALEKHISTLAVGTELSGQHTERWVPKKIIHNLFDAVSISLHMSIMKTAAEEEAIASRIYQHMLGFRPAEIVTGDSQGGITAAARIAYADEMDHGETAAVDIRALCCYEKTSLASAAFWLSKELTLGSVVIGDMLLKRETEHLLQTPSRKPGLQIGASMGKIPVLLSGELQKTISQIDKSTPGQVLRYVDDDMSPEDGMSHWDGFYDLNHRNVDGTHFRLPRLKGIISQVDRIAREVEIRQSRGNLHALSPDEALYIYGRGSLTEVLLADSSQDKAVA